jgi:hypothetical protein
MDAGSFPSTGVRSGAAMMSSTSKLVHDLVAVSEVGQRQRDLVLREVRHACHRLAVQADADARGLGNCGCLLECQQPACLVKREHDEVSGLLPAHFVDVVKGVHGLIRGDSHRRGIAHLFERRNALS